MCVSSVCCFTAERVILQGVVICCLLQPVSQLWTANLGNTILNSAEFKHITKHVSGEKATAMS